MLSRLKNLIRIIPLLCWTFLIVVLSTRENIPDTSGFVKFPGFDKIAHAGAYFIWCLFGFFALAGKKMANFGSVVVVSTAIGLGILLEYVQLWFFPARFFEVLDIISNIIGALSSLLAKRFLTP